jgi:O-methyltransferase involved in polyketide biosynthesis
VMEGLTAYLDAEEGRKMMGVLCEHFRKRGGEVLVDTAGRLTGWISGVFGYIWRVKGRVGWVRWAVDPGELEKLHGG